MTPARLKEIKERAEKATAGPWAVDRPFLSFGHMTVAGVMPRENLHPEAPYLVKIEHNHGSCSYAKHVAMPSYGHTAEDKSDAARNMEFIAHARTDIPDLLAEVERLRGALEHYARCDGYCATDECVCSTAIARKALEGA